MPHNKNSWSREMKSPDFFDRYKLNTNPAIGRTYIPIEGVAKPSKPHKKSNGNVPSQLSKNNNDTYLADVIEKSERTGLDAVAEKIMKKYNMPSEDWHYFDTVLSALKEMYNIGKQDKTSLHTA